MTKFYAIIGWLIGTLVLSAQTNSPPTVRIAYPPEGYYGRLVFKVKAEVADRDSRVAEVRFFDNDQLIGVVTNAPFNIIWRINGGLLKLHVLTAQAKDDLGASGSSLPVNIIYSPPHPAVYSVPIIAPTNGALFALSENIDFSAEVLATEGESGPVKFIVDGSLIGELNQTNGLTATNPPLSVIVSNLTEGFHSFAVAISEQEYCDCDYMTSTVQVVKLGIANPLLSEGKVAFEIVSAFPDRLTSIERTGDLTGGWQVITNFTPGARRARFSDPPQSTATNLWYRVVIP